MRDSIKMLCGLDLLTSLPVIIANLVFVYVDASSCLSQMTSFQITLYQWLCVYAYMQCFFLFCALCVLAYRYTFNETVHCMMALLLILLIFNTLFQVIWLIIGSIIHWKEIKQSACTNLNIYMNGLLVAQYFLIALNLVLSYKYHMEIVHENLALKKQSQIKSNVVIQEENRSNMDFIKTKNK